MNALIHTRSGYAQPDATLLPPRALEYEAFARMTRKLASAWAGRKTNFPALVAALNDNLSLWRILAADVAETDNGLPGPLRAQLFYLYEFADQQTDQILQNGASVDVLIDINSAIMRGLRGQGGEE